MSGPSSPTKWQDRALKQCYDYDKAWKDCLEDAWGRRESEIKYAYRFYLYPIQILVPQAHVQMPAEKRYLEKSTHAWMQGKGQMSFVFVTCLSPIVWLRGWIESGAVDWTPTPNSCGFRSSGQPGRLEGELDQKAVGRAPASAMNKEGKAL